MSRWKALGSRATALLCGVILFVSSGATLGQELTDSSRFSHAFHVADAEIDCATCHSSIDTSRSSQDNNLPTNEACLSCHETVKALPAYGIRGNVPLTAASQVRFDHSAHLARNAVCKDCHGDAAKDISPTSHLRPTMATCFTCHDGKRADRRCELCHQGKVSLVDIHPGDWRHQHGSHAAQDRSWCASCHQLGSSCVACHQGDNLTLTIHPSNFRFTHGLDAKVKQADCTQCHDNRSFCGSCHEANNRIPLNHSTAGWRVEHGRAAREDIENCASCHDDDDPTCSRAGCHNDFDGIRGTNPPIHGTGGMIAAHGPWHADDSYFCYRCHSNSRQSGIGFCGYCHERD